VTLVLWSFYSPGPAGSLVLHVAGGVHATAEPQHVLDYGWDLAAIGEGRPRSWPWCRRCATALS
jgi:hypothetical protein